MSEITPLDMLGIAPGFFRLPLSVAEFETLDYYLIGGEEPRYIQQASYWDIIGVGKLRHDPNGLILRQIHIEEEAREWLAFDAWADSEGSFALNPSELAALRKFLLRLAAQLPDVELHVGQHTYFSSMPVDIYTNFGIPARLVERFRPLLERDTRLYLYCPDAMITTAEACRLLHLSEWTSPWPQSATVSFGFETYTPTRITAIQEAYERFVRDQATNRAIAADIMDGESTMHLSSGALRAVATLLSERLAMLGRGDRGTFSASPPDA